jgi:hypothetical protein
MISYADVEKLRSLQVPESAVLSVYLRVPPDLAGLRSLAARADELMAAALSAADGMHRAGLQSADREAVQEMLAAHGRQWLGCTAAIFACSDVALLEALPVGCLLPERVVLAARPHVRPLLAALQRCPDYLVAIADGRHASVMSVSGDRVRLVAVPATAAPGVPTMGGGPELEADRIVPLPRGGSRDVLSALARALGSDRRPLVLGGQQHAVGRLIQAMPPEIGKDYAGSFHADPRTLTAASLRALGGAVMERWSALRERRLAEEVLGAAGGDLIAVGLTACLTAVNAGAVGRLLVADEPMVPGFECGRCNALSTTGDDCPDWGTAAQAVPDLLEEMAWRSRHDGGQVIAVRDATVSAAAKLRFGM